MLLAEPAPTQLDLNFRLLGVPVRVSPWFWATTFLLSGGALGKELIIWVPCVFLSILIHEMGHALSGRLFGDHPYVVLHGMGGLCFPRREHRPWKRSIVILSGPGAGFLAAGAAYGVRLATFHSTLNPSVELALEFLMWINLVWGVLNLLPIWPLDGGQLLLVLLPLLNRRRGARWTHTIGLLGAGMLGIYVLYRSEGTSLWNVFLLGMLAFSNYQRLQALHEAAKYGIDNDDWWRG